MARSDRIDRRLGARTGRAVCRVRRSESRVSSAVRGSAGADSAADDLAGDGPAWRLVRRTAGNVARDEFRALAVSGSRSIGLFGVGLAVALPCANNRADAHRLPRHGRVARASGPASGRSVALACDLEMGARRASDPSRRANLDRQSCCSPCAGACRRRHAMHRGRPIGWIAPVLLVLGCIEQMPLRAELPSFDVAPWNDLRRRASLHRCSRRPVISGRPRAGVDAVSGPVGGDVGRLGSERAGRQRLLGPLSARLSGLDAVDDGCGTAGVVARKICRNSHDSRSGKTMRCEV